ncbi:MAG: hypothetical protein U9Q69_05345, partial [Nanoarchaeota archaeon]|nr:hypothetical protein [Nanoarchaeota archaeon]
FFKLSGMDNVIVSIFAILRPPLDYVNPQEPVEIYKSSDSENISDYELINVKDAYELMEEGSKVSFLDENLEKIEVEGIEKEAYDGRIYDVTVPNHVILVKRDGLIAWSGNSLHRNFTSLSSGSYTYTAYVVDKAGNLNETLVKARLQTI